MTFDLTRKTFYLCDREPPKSAVMYYQPVRKDATKVALPWQVRSIFFKVAWPLQDNASLWMRILDALLLIFILFSFTYATEAAINFLVRNLDDIGLSTEAFAAIIIYNDSLVRLIHMALRKRSFKDLLRKFYAGIYVDESESFVRSKKIQRSNMLLQIYTWSYLIPVFAFCLSPLLAGIVQNSRVLPYRLTFHHGVENPLIYFPLSLLLMFNSTCVCLLLTGEFCMLSTFIGHLCARYRILQNYMEDSAIRLLDESTPEVAFEFRQIVGEGIKMSQDLNCFAVQLKDAYSFRIFVMLVYSGPMLCVVIFQSSILELRSAKFVAFMLWMLGKALELILLGELGSRLTSVTDEISSMYYQCKWEAVVNHSSNTKQNILLMKQVLLAILLCSKPVTLNGCGFFDISLETTASIIRCAGSYFTFLKTFQ